MRTFRTAAAAAALILLGVSASASDRIGVYAKVDKVVFEPSATAPQAVQVWGVFSVAVTTNADDYQPPARGYLYFKLPADPSAAAAAAREWADLNAVAGKGQVVAFGTRRDLRAHVRDAKERPSNPDTYTVNIGVTRIRSDSGYEPVRLLRESR